MIYKNYTFQYEGVKNFVFPFLKNLDSSDLVPILHIKIKKNAIFYIKNCGARPILKIFENGNQKFLTIISKSLLTYSVHSQQ